MENDIEDVDPLPALAEYFVVAGISDSDSKGKHLSNAYSAH